MMISRAYRYLNLLSIDVAAGAAVGAAFFANIFHVDLLPQAYVVLGLTVWIIYTADHLLDAFRLDKPASTARHLLHQRNFRALCWATGIVVVIDVALALFVRVQLLIPGLIVSVACAAYLVMSRWLRFLKEVAGAVLYSSGVLLPSLSLSQPLEFDLKLVVAQFVLIVFVNMLLFARMSYTSDVRDDQHSLFTTIGLRQGDWLIAISFLCLVVLMAWPATGVFPATRIVMAAMALTLFLIYVFPAYFRSHERYRLVGDSVFLFPGILLILQ
jgi:hypothetical protein